MTTYSYTLKLREQALKKIKPAQFKNEHFNQPHWHQHVDQLMDKIRLGFNQEESLYVIEVSDTDFIILTTLLDKSEWKLIDHWTTSTSSFCQ